ncbi:MAG: phosphoribosyltransferase [Bacteroidia bacterium]
MSKLQILKHDEIMLKLGRIAWQILEEFYESKNIVIIGIKSRGTAVAKLIETKLAQISKAEIEFIEFTIDKDKALTTTIEWSDEINLKGKAVVLVDDVLNSGITLAGALKEILSKEPKSVKVAVLANRDHKAFPIHADFVGISLATTLKEHISLVRENGNMAVYLV